MTIYPAIDLRNGRCVRLFQGKADQETVYYQDPSEPAQLWKKQGASRLHVVDLDGAFSGSTKNLEAVRSIVEMDDLKVQLGGGMRDQKAVEQALELGVDRVIVGTRACTEPEWASNLVEEFGCDRIVVGIDAKNGMVSTKGWVETTSTPALQLAAELQELGIRWIIHTDVATDGAMKGPNLEAQSKMAEAVPLCKVIASGGVTTEQDVFDLVNLAEKIENLEGVIIGRALYEKTVTLENLMPSA